MTYLGEHNTSEKHCFFMQLACIDTFIKKKWQDVFIHTYTDREWNLQFIISIPYTDFQFFPPPLSLSTLLVGYASFRAKIQIVQQRQLPTKDPPPHTPFLNLPPSSNGLWLTEMCMTVLLLIVSLFQCSRWLSHFYTLWRCIRIQSSSLMSFVYFPSCLFFFE